MYLKDNSLGEDMPIVPILRAMGVQSEQEIVTMVGAEPEIVGAMAASLEETRSASSHRSRRCTLSGPRSAASPGALSQNRYGYSYRQQPPVDEACDALAQVVLPQVSVRAFDFRPNININGNCVPAMRATSSTARRKTVTIPLCCLQAMTSEFFCHPPSKCACLHLLSKKLSKNVNLFCAHSVC